MNIDELFKDDPSDKAISAFAHSTARLLEHMIKVTSNNALERVKELETKILEYRSLVADVFHEDELQQYDEHFSIVDTKNGNTNPHEDVYRDQSKQ